MHPINLRVYGLLTDHGSLLVSDEYYNGQLFTKLPGGGLEPREGTKDCLIREFKEETGLSIEVGEHFYTTDFYLPSAFDPSEQILSVYYWVHCADLSPLKTADKPFAFATGPSLDGAQNAQSLRWVPWEQLSAETLSLPIDQKVMELLVERRPKGRESSQLATRQPAAYYLQRAPFVVPTTDRKLIEEHFGYVATGNPEISIAHMVAPAGWSEPAQIPEFDEWTLVNSGRKRLEINGEEIILSKGESIWISKGARVRYSNPFDEPCDYWSVCLPAFSLSSVHRQES